MPDLVVFLPATKILMDPASSTITYSGYASAGSVTSAAVWQISRLTYNVGGQLIAQEWADANGNYDNIWDNRASLSYS